MPISLSPAFNLFLPIWSELYKLTFFKIRWIQLEEATRLLSDFVFRSFMKGMIHLFFASTSILINLDYSWVNISKTQMVILVFMVRNREQLLFTEKIENIPYGLLSRTLCYLTITCLSSVTSPFSRSCTLSGTHCITCSSLYIQCIL